MFCTKCGNEIKEGGRFCTKCGAPAPVIQQAQEPEPIPQAATTSMPHATPAQKPKSTNGVMLPMAIIAAACCLFALIHFIVGCNITFNLHVFHGIIGAFLVLNMIAYAVGIATGILSKKLAFLAAIPLPILILANIAEFSRAFIGAPPNPNYIRLMFTQQKGFVTEIIMAIILLALFILAAVMKNKVGIILGAISAAWAVILVVVTVSSITGPFVRNVMFMNNPEMLFAALRMRVYSFARIPFYTSYIALSVGVLIRNIKAAKGK